MNNAELDCIRRFYRSFQQKDAEGMIACYHKDLVFEDPVFSVLDYKGACAMWEMLTSAKGAVQIDFSNEWSEDDRGGAHWEARYVFSKTGRSVHNKIDASFRFKDGLIISHSDYFDFYRWSRMAFGSTGLALGWTSYFKGKVSKVVKKQLSKFMDPDVH